MCYKNYKESGCNNLKEYVDYLMKESLKKERIYIKIRKRKEEIEINKRKRKEARYVLINKRKLEKEEERKKRKEKLIEEVKINRKIIKTKRLIFEINKPENNIREKIISLEICYDKRIECSRCSKEINITKDMRHHIIPRKYNGSDDDYNRISLCYSCHDYVEIKTEDWIASGKRYDTDILRSMIINDGFE